MIWLWRKDSNLRMAALTVRCLTNLATPQYDWECGCVLKQSHFPYFICHSHYFSSAICRVYFALFRVISWIVRWPEKRRTIHEITRTMATNGE